MQILVTGNVNADILMGRLDGWPDRGTETLMAEFEQRLGGPLGNMAQALRQLDANARYLVNVGDDSTGRELADQLRPLGCEPEVTSGPTSVTFGLVHGDGQRTFFTSPGHLGDFTLDSTFRAVEEARPGDMLFLCGYFLLPEMEQRAPELLEFARARGLVTALDTGWPPAGWDGAVREQLRAALRHCTYFLPNEIELESYVGRTGSVAELLGAADEGRDGLTLVKLGERGAAWLQDGRLVTVPASRIRVADSIGAGDSFNAGFAAALQRGLGLKAAAETGIRVASRAISSSPREYPRWSDLEPVAEH